MIDKFELRLYDILVDEFTDKYVFILSLDRYLFFYQGQMLFISLDFAHKALEVDWLNSDERFGCTSHMDEATLSDFGTALINASVKDYSEDFTQELRNYFEQK